jgi:hypothetical protein
VHAIDFTCKVYLNLAPGSFRPLSILSDPEAPPSQEVRASYPNVRVISSEFETCPDWVPSLDGSASSARMPLVRKRLDWFERAVLQAAKVRNVSNVGSQLLVPENRAI